MHLKLSAYSDRSKTKSLALTVLPGIGWCDVKSGCLCRGRGLWELPEACVTAEQEQGGQVQTGLGEPAGEATLCKPAGVTCQVITAGLPQVLGRADPVALPQLGWIM